MPYIHLKTPIPGPQSQALQARRAAAVSSALAQANPVAVKKAHGSLVEDLDGNTLIDLAGGIGALAVGHTPRGVVEAIQAQADELLHMCSIVANYEPYVALNRLTPVISPRRPCSLRAGPRPWRTRSSWPAATPDAQGLSSSRGPTTGAAT